MHISRGTKPNDNGIWYTPDRSSHPDEKMYNAYLNFLSAIILCINNLAKQCKKAVHKSDKKTALL